jgi:hypothetical protein
MMDTEPNFTDSSFEKFHAHWEWLIRCLYRGRAVSLNALYKGRNEEILTRIPDNLQIVLHHKKGLVRLRNQFPSNKNFAASVEEFPSELNSKNAATEEFPSESTPVEDNVMLCAIDNPGIDILLKEQTIAPTRNIAIGIECKFSDIDASTQLTSAEIRRKKDLFEKSFNKGECTLFNTDSTDDSIYKAFNINPKDRYFIMAAFRDSPEKWTKADIPENTIVLRRSDIKHLYGPTLQARPQFILSKLYPEFNTIKRGYHSYTKVRPNSVYKNVFFGKIK